MEREKREKDTLPQDIMALAKKGKGKPATKEKLLPHHSKTNKKSSEIKIKQYR
jgi:hypothetical protein